jgi:hypothetical protein
LGLLFGSSANSIRTMPDTHGFEENWDRVSSVRGPFRASCESRRPCSSRNPDGSVGRQGAVHPIRIAPRPLLPRVVVPLEGRSSGSRISRSCTPSQPLHPRGTFPFRNRCLVEHPLPDGSPWKKWSVAYVCSSSPVTATGSRRIYTGFPQVRVALFPFIRRKSRIGSGTSSNENGILRLVPVPRSKVT